MRHHESSIMKPAKRVLFDTGVAALLRPAPSAVRVVASAILSNYDPNQSDVQDWAPGGDLLAQARDLLRIRGYTGPSYDWRARRFSFHAADALGHGVVGAVVLAALRSCSITIRHMRAYAVWGAVAYLDEPEVEYALHDLIAAGVCPVALSFAGRGQPPGDWCPAQAPPFELEEDHGPVLE